MRYGYWIARALLISLLVIIGLLLEFGPVDRFAKGHFLLRVAVLAGVGVALVLLLRVVARRGRSGAN
jgi:hypothetical protein